MTAVVYLGLMHILPSVVTTNSGAVLVDMRLSSGSSVELYVNDVLRPPFRQSLAPGKRQLYRFEPILEDIHSLRLDPTDIDSATIDIYGITVTNDEESIQVFDPAALAASRFGGVTGPRVIDGTLHIISTSNDPIITLNMAAPIFLRHKDLPKWAPLLLKESRQPTVVTYVIVFGVLALFLSGLTRPDLRLHIVIGVIVTLVGIVLGRWVLQHYYVLPPIDKAVGRAGFLGLSTQANTLASQLTLLAALSTAIATALVERRLVPGEWAGRRTPTSNFSLHTSASWWRTYGVPLLATIIIFLTFVPDIGSQLREQITQEFPAGCWDCNNSIVWGYLIHRGYKPFLDFWYPYGGFYLFSLPTPAGEIFNGLYSTLIYSCLFYAVYRLSRRRVWTASLVVVVLLAGERTAVSHDANLFFGVSRYLIGLEVGLIYLCVDRRDRLQAAHFWFWMICSLALFFEPFQLLYAAPGILLLLGLEIFQGWPPSWPALGRRVLRAFGLPAILSTGLLVAYALTGQLAGLVEFYAQLGQHAKSSAFPSDLAYALRHLLSVDFMVFVAPYLLVALGLFERLRRPAQTNLWSDVLIVIGLNGFMLLQKHLVRPISWTLFFIPALGLMSYILFRLKSRPPADYPIMGIIAGVLLPVLVQPGSLSGLTMGAIEGPGRLARSIQVVLFDSALIHRGLLKRYAPERFAKFTGVNAVAAWVQTTAPPTSVKPKIFVLGDSSILYVLLQQRPPYSTNNYNMSPLGLQRRQVEWLQNERPDYVIWAPQLDHPSWAPQYNSIDSIQHAVRVPLVYNYVIEHYVPMTEIEGYQILRQRQHNEAIPVDFWRDKLEPVVHLGHLARVSSFPSFKPCLQTQTEDCQDFLWVHLADTTPRGREIVPIIIAGRSFRLTLETVKTEDDYYVLMDRVWFWGPLLKAGYTPLIVSKGLSEAVSVSVVKRLVRPDVLY